MTTRREFIWRLVLAPAALAGMARSAAGSEGARRVWFGVIADVHQDVMPDGVKRVRAFVAAMEKSRPDFIVQLGDFCQPLPRNRAFLDAFQSFSGPRHHVLGNHDMDGGFTREQTATFYGMPDLHYAFTAGPVRVLVLDGNDPGGKAKGYARFIGADQLAWLGRELAQADRPVVIFVHQPLDDAGGVENGADVRAVIERSATRVAAVFTGHLHLDYARMVNGVRHIQINSASYFWLGNPAAHRETFPPAVHKTHPYLRHVAAYRDPLWALVMFDFERGELVVEGRRTEWVGPDPWQRGETTQRPRDHLHPVISDRRETLAA